MWSNNNVVLVLATIALCLVALAPKPAQGLSCIQCPTDPLEHRKLCGPCPKDCKYGLVRDICGCCRVCGGGPGDKCGGFGTPCGIGLRCELPQIEEGSVIVFPQTGICVER